MSATTSDFVASLAAELKNVQDSLISGLIAGKAADHDSVAGQIKGIERARKLVLDHGRKFQAYVDEDDVEAFRSSDRRQTTLSLL